MKNWKRKENHVPKTDGKSRYEMNQNWKKGNGEEKKEKDVTSVAEEMGVIVIV